MVPTLTSNRQPTYNLIHDACPTIHEGLSLLTQSWLSDILDYAAGYIDDSDEEDNNPTDYVQSLLLSAGANPSALTPLINKLNNLIATRIAQNPLKKTLEPVRLESTVQIAAQRGTGSTLNVVGPKVDLDSITGRKVESRVDVKKLEKVIFLSSLSLAMKRQKKRAD